MEIYTAGECIKYTDKINETAESFIESNKDYLKKELLDFVDGSDYDSPHFKSEPIFLLTGQSIANILTSNIEGILHNKEYNDLDIFYFPFQTGIKNEFVEGSSSEVELKYGFNGDLYSRITRVYDNPRKMKFDIVENSIQKTENIKLQFIEIDNIFCKYHMKDTANRFEKAAFKILNNFDIYNVKLGILVNANMDKCKLIIHPEAIKVINYYANMPVCKHRNTVSIMRALSKCSASLSYSNYDLQDQLRAKYTAQHNEKLDSLLLGNNFIKKYFDEGLNHDTRTDKLDLRYQSRTLEKFLRVKQKASYSLITKSTSFVDELSGEFDNYLIYKDSCMMLNSDKKEFNVELLEILTKHKQIIADSLSCLLYDIIYFYKKIKNKKHYIEFLEKVLELKNNGYLNDNFYAKLVSVIFRNFDKLVKLKTIDELIDILKLLYHNYSIQSSCMMHEWPEKAILDAIENINIISIFENINHVNYNLLSFKNISKYLNIFVKQSVEYMINYSADNYTTDKMNMDRLNCNYFEKFYDKRIIFEVDYIDNLFEIKRSNRYDKDKLLYVIDSILQKFNNTTLSDLDGNVFNIFNIDGDDFIVFRRILIDGQNKLIFVQYSDNIEHSRLDDSVKLVIDANAKTVSTITDNDISEYNNFAKYYKMLTLNMIKEINEQCYSF